MSNVVQLFKKARRWLPEDGEVVAAWDVGGRYYRVWCIDGPGSYGFACWRLPVGDEARNRDGMVSQDFAVKIDGDQVVRRVFAAGCEEGPGNLDWTIENFATH